MTTLFPPPVAELPAAPATPDTPMGPSPITPDHSTMGIVHFRLKVSRPSCRPQIKGGKMEVNEHEVKAKDRTAGNYKIDKHEIWSKLDRNETEARHVLHMYSVNSADIGVNFVPEKHAAKVRLELNRCTDRRNELIQWFVDHYDEVLTKLRDDCVGPDKMVADHQTFDADILPAIPAKHALPDRLKMVHTMTCIAPANNEKIGVFELDDAEQAEIIEQNRSEYEGQVKNMMQLVGTQMAAEILKTLEQYTTTTNEKGKLRLEGGKRRTGALNDLMDLFSRLKNFDDYIKPDVLERVRHAEAVVEEQCGWDIGKVNSSTTVQSQIKVALQPLQTALQGMIDSHTEAAVPIEL